MIGFEGEKFNLFSNFKKPNKSRRNSAPNYNNPETMFNKERILNETQKKGTKFCCLYWELGREDKDTFMMW